MSDLLLQLQRTAALALQSQTVEEGMRHLSFAFQLFSEETARLKVSSDKLQQRLQTVNEDLVQNMAELNHLTHYLNNILQNISQGILFVDLEGTIRTFNDCSSKLLGKKAQDLLARSFETCFPDEYFGFSMKEALRFGIAQKLLYKTIDSKELEISTTFVFVGPKQYHGLIVLLRDITELQRLQRAASQNSRMKELGEMAASMAHEIRNPLGGIRGYAQLLHRDLAEQKNLQEMAATVIDGTKSLETLVTTILQYAKPVQIQPQSLELGAFLKQLAKFVRVDPTLAPNVKLEIHIPQEPLLAPADPEAIKACLLNLIFNAFQAKADLVTVSLIQFESSCQITVSDDGAGIDPKHLASIFSPFFTTKTKGTGLGLVEAQKIAQAHHGTLDVRSQVGRGSTFTLTLPLKR